MLRQQGMLQFVVVCLDSADSSILSQRAPGRDRKMSDPLTVVTADSRFMIAAAGRPLPEVSVLGLATAGLALVYAYHRLQTRL